MVLATLRAGKQTPTKPRPIAATNHSATPFLMARLGAYVKDEGNPLALAFTTKTTDAATTQAWPPHPRTPPAIIRTFALLLAALARAGHLEDDCNPPVTHRWSPMPTQHAIVATSVLGGISTCLTWVMNGLRFRVVIGLFLSVLQSIWGEQYFSCSYFWVKCYFTATLTDAATTQAWPPHPRTPPAIIRTFASLLAALARAGHLEDNCNLPVTSLWSPMPTQHAIVSTSVLGGISTCLTWVMNGLRF